MAIERKYQRKPDDWWSGKEVRTIYHLKNTDIPEGTYGNVF